MASYVLGVSRTRDLPRLQPQAGTEPGLSSRPDPACTLEPEGADPARWIISGELAAALAPRREMRPKPAEHAQILAAIHRRINVVPVRYGTAMPDDDAVRRVLQERSRELSCSLDRLEGRCELGVRIALAPQNAVQCAAPSARLAAGDYLARRRSEYEWADRLSRCAGQATRRVVDAADGLHRQWRSLPTPAAGLVRLSFLVDRSGVEEFEQRMGTLRLERTPDRYTLLGPWPPYSFV